MTAPKPVVCWRKVGARPLRIAEIYVRRPSAPGHTTPPVAHPTEGGSYGGII